MRTSSAARRFHPYPTLTTLLSGVLFLASVAPLYAEPASMQPVDWFATSCGAIQAPRNGFVLPTLALTAPGAGPRLVVTQNALRASVPMRPMTAASQAPPTPKSQKSWFGRNWWWVIPIGVVVAGVLVVNVYCSSNPNMCGD